MAPRAILCDVANGCPVLVALLWCRGVDYYEVPLRWPEAAVL